VSVEWFKFRVSNLALCRHLYMRRSISVNSLLKMLSSADSSKTTDTGTDNFNVL
jgi:hypothetical protein